MPEDLEERYKPVLDMLGADRGIQADRVRDMFLMIMEARDAEELAAKGVFVLAPDHVPSDQLNERYKPLIAIMLATRDKQMSLVKQLSTQVRDTGDGEAMQARKKGRFVDGRPEPLVTKRVSEFLAPPDSDLDKPDAGAPRKGG